MALADLAAVPAALSPDLARDEKEARAAGVKIQAVARGHLTATAPSMPRRTAVQQHRRHQLRTLPTGRFAFHARIVRAEETAPMGIRADGLGCTERVNAFEFVASLFQFAQHLFADAFFDNEFVRLPLVMKARLSKRRGRVHARSEERRVGRGCQ